MGEHKKLATRLRLDFVPVDLGPQGIQDLHIVLITLMPGGWEYFLEHGKVTRLDVAVDFPALAMDDFHCLPTKGATSTVWKANGELSSFTHGSFKGSHTAIYNREAKRKLQKKQWQGVTGIRVESRLKQAVGFLADLPGLANPFGAFMLVKRIEGPPPAKVKATLWSLFLHVAEFKGLPAALGMLTEDDRTVFRKHFAAQVQPWWDVEKLWSEWPKSLDDLTMLNPQAWG